MTKFTVLVCRVGTIFCLLNAPITAKLLPRSDVTHSKCIEKILEKFFVGESVLVMLPKFSAQINEQFVRMLHGTYAVTIIDKKHKIIKLQLNKPSNTLFLTDTRLDLIQTVNYLKLSGLWNPGAPVLVILRNEMVAAKRASLLNMREAKRIFEVFMRESSMKVILVTFDEHQTPKIFTWFPFDDENNCGSRVHTVQCIGECLSDAKAKNDNFLISTNYTNLSITPRTFNDCPLHVTTIATGPYAMCTTKFACENGIEIRLFESVSQSLKLSLKLQIEEKVNEIVYSRIFNRESDLLIGGINPLMKIRNKRLTQTVPYYQDELTWCVLEASTIPLWLSIFQIASPKTWLLFSFLMLFASTFLYYFYKFYHRPENWCYCTAVGFFLALSVPVPFDPSHRLLRIVYLSFGIGGILLTTAFNSFLMSAIAQPAQFKQISTQEELIEHAVKLYADNETITLYESSETRDEISEYFLHNNRRCGDTRSCLDEFVSSSSANIAVAASLEHALYYLNMVNDSKIYCFHTSENIYVYPVAALAHEHFHLLDAINHQIQRVIESGLIINWNADIRLTEKSNFVNHVAVPFTILNVSGSFEALAIGLTAASISFSLEIYFKAKRRSSQTSQPRVWRVCERILITPERNAWSEIIRYIRWKWQMRKSLF